MRISHLPALALLLALALPAEIVPVIPPGAAKPVGPYTPGLLAGKFLYVSGQGVRGADNVTPPTLEAQTRQCIENVKAIVEAAGLTLNHVVHTQLYLTSASQLPAVERVYGEYFALSRPARTTVIAARLPTDTSIELTAVALRDLKDKQILPGRSPAGPNSSFAVRAAGRVYFSSMPGASREKALRALRQAFERAGLAERNLLFVNEFAVPPRTDGNSPIAALPGGSPYAVAAVASATPPPPATFSSPCRAAADALFCSIAAAPPELRDMDRAARALLDSFRDAIRKHGFRIEDTVAANVYVNDLQFFGQMNAAYASFFGPVPPTRTTIQPLAPSPDGPLIRMSLVVARE